MKKLILLLISIVCIDMSAQTQENHIQKQIDELHKNTKKRQDSVGVLIKECNALIEKSTDSITSQELNKKLTKLWSIYGASLREEVSKDIDFAIKHPTSLVCVKHILYRIQQQEGMGFYDKYEQIYQNLSLEIKVSEEGKIMGEKLKYFKQSGIDSIAPDFSVKDINGSNLNLNDFRNKKYVLLEFWASWCAPCIDDQKYLKKIYQKFSKHNFEIISISRDTDIEKWKKTILKHKTDIWKHACIVSDLNKCEAESTIISPPNKEGEKSSNSFQINGIEKNKKSVDVNYFVSGIPHYVLIDKTGIIIGKWKGSGELNMQELDNKLAEIFLNK